MSAIFTKTCYQGVAVAHRILLELWRQKRSLVLWVIFPVCLLLLNSLVLAEGGSVSLAEAFRLATPATVVGAALFFSCVGGTMATIVAERESLTLKRLLLSPLVGNAYFLGIYLAYLCIGLGQSLLVYGVAYFWQVRFAGAWPLGGLIILLSVAAYVGIGFGFGTQFARRPEDMNGLVAGVGVPLLILGGAFFPTRFLPETLRQMAELNPIYHMNSALSLVSVNGIGLDDSRLLGHLGFLGLFAALSIGLGGIAYRRLIFTERQL